MVRKKAYSEDDTNLITNKIDNEHKRKGSTSVIPQTDLYTKDISKADLPGDSTRSSHRKTRALDWFQDSQTRK